MAIGPITRSGQPIILSRDEAKEINCLNLKATLTRDLFAVDISIIVEAGHTDEAGKWVGFTRTPLPDSDVKITDLFSPTFGQFMVTVRYVSGHSRLDPDEKMTRLEFVMQTLEIWDRIFARGNSEGVEAAINVLKTTYAFTELIPAEQVKNLFAPTKELTNGA